MTLWRPGGRSRGIESSAAQNAPSRPTVRAFQAIFTRPGPAAEAAAPCGDFRWRMKCGLDLLDSSLSHFDPQRSSALATIARIYYPSIVWSQGDKPMHSANAERSDAKVRAIEDALSRLGEPITEAQAKAIAALEDCECKEGMFALSATRRHLFAGAGLVAAVGMTGMLPRAASGKAPAGAIEYPVPADSTKEPGRVDG